MMNGKKRMVRLGGVLVDKTQWGSFGESDHGSFLLGI